MLDKSTQANMHINYFNIKPKELITSADTEETRNSIQNNQNMANITDSILPINLRGNHGINE